MAVNSGPASREDGAGIRSAATRSTPPRVAAKRSQGEDPDGYSSGIRLGAALIRIPHPPGGLVRDTRGGATAPAVTTSPVTIVLGRSRGTGPLAPANFVQCDEPSGR